MPGIELSCAELMDAELFINSLLLFPTVSSLVGMEYDLDDVLVTLH